MSCAEVRRVLDSLHDDELELELERQIAVEAHLVRCEECAARRGELSTIRKLIRGAAAVSESADYDDEMLAELLMPVVAQVREEGRLGWRVRLGHRVAEASSVWIPGGAVAMTAVGALVLAAVLTLLPLRSDSLAAVLYALANPGSNANPVTRLHGVTLPTVASADPLPTLLRAPAVDFSANLALAAVVTREGLVSRVEVLRSSAFSEAFEGNLSQLTSDIRFSPALYDGLPVAVNVVWLLEQATVRGYETVPPLVTPSPTSHIF
jgi:hypothetical protein